MTEELKEIGLNIGHRRVGLLMRQNGISVTRTRKHKVTDGKIWIGKTRFGLRTASSPKRFGPNPLITIPARGF